MRPIRDILRDAAIFNSEGKHINGCDKMSNHNYGDAYESLFPSKRGEPTVGTYLGDIQISTREQVKLVMEIGVADGSCLRAWREAFPNATIVGMDIHHSDKAHGERIEFHLGDQTSREDCERAAAGRQFDLIIEDATHDLNNSLLTLLFLYPFVKPGGLYVIEEFSRIHELKSNVKSLWPNVEIVDTQGPFGGIEPLVVFRKPL